MPLADLIARFDVDDPTFIADPYPVLNALREATPGFVNERTGQWTITRFPTSPRRCAIAAWAAATATSTPTPRSGATSPIRAGRRSSTRALVAAVPRAARSHRIRRLVAKVFRPRPSPRCGPP
jgi:hypothetical protein